MKNSTAPLKTAEDQLNAWYKKAQQVSPVRILSLSRGQLAGMFCKFGFKKGAEIGVDRGTFSKVMCEANPDLELLCVDPWHWKLRGESRHKTAVERLKPYNCKIDRRRSTEAARDVKDGSLDFVYIDGDHHFDFVMMDIITWAKKVREGGIVAGHDYYRFRQAGVVDAVDVYTKMHRIDRWFLTDYLKDRTPSFFWINKKDRWDA